MLFLIWVTIIANRLFIKKYFLSDFPLSLSIWLAIVPHLFQLTLIAGIHRIEPPSLGSAKGSNDLKNVVLLHADSDRDCDSGGRCWMRWVSLPSPSSLGEASQSCLSHVSRPNSALARPVVGVQRATNWCCTKVRCLGLYAPAALANRCLLMTGKILEAWASRSSRP